MIAPEQGERGRLLAGCLPRQRFCRPALFGLDRLALDEVLEVAVHLSSWKVGWSMRRNDRRAGLYSHQ